MTDRFTVGHGSTLRPGGGGIVPFKGIDFSAVNRNAPGYAEYAARLHGEPGIPYADEPRHRPILIALTAPAMGSGKSTIAEHLKSKHGFVLLKFAGPLKAMTRTLFGSIGMNAEEIEARVEGNLKEEIIPALQVSARRVMQNIGSELGRNCWHKNVWADATKARAEYFLARGQSVVIDDMRYLNELDAIIDIGGVPLRVVRPGATVTLHHSSEGELNDVSMAEISNHGTIEDLHLLVDNTVAHLLDDQF